MSQKSLAVLLIRILGIYCIIKIVEHVGVILLGYLQMGEHGKLSDLYPAMVAISPLLAFLIITAIILFSFSKKIADRLCSDTGETGKSGNLSEDSLYLLAFTVVGIVVLIWKAVPELTNLILNVLNAKQADLESYAKQSIIYAWYSGFKMILYSVIAVFLIFRGWGIIELIHKFRKT